MPDSWDKRCRACTATTIPARPWPLSTITRRGFLAACSDRRPTSRGSMLCWRWIGAQSALAILDRLDIPDTTRGRELVVVRAELRVGAKRYAEAIADFTRALADVGADALAERALHGRIACDLATGKEALARADLQDYLIRFREGRFASEVRRRLGDIDRRP